MIHRIVAVAVTSALLAGSAGCVSEAKYNQAIVAADKARDDLAAERARLKDAQLVRSATQKDLEVAQKGRAEMQKQLDDATAVDEQLSKELKRLGEDAASLLAVNGGLKDSLEVTQRRLADLRRAQAAAEARAALYRDLAKRLKGMVDAGDLAITLREGRMVLRMSNDVLFDSGKAQLKPAGQRALSELADVLKSVEGRRFQVAGHTDDDPIRYSPFRSNWELSSVRALAVTAFLTAKGVDPRALSAAGYGEFDPVDTNETAEGKAHNRRTEITVQPHIDEMVAVPEAP